LTSPAFTFRKTDLDSIARSLEPELRDAFLRAAARMRELVPVGQLTELLEAGQFTQIFDLVGNLGLDAAARTALRDGLLQASIGVAEASAAEFGLAFDIVNPYAVRWAQQHAANTIQGISAETQQAVWDIIQRALIEGNAPRVAARDIRRIVGLTQRDALAVDRFLQGLGAAPNARTMADRMADRLLRRRAENIARTETMLAANRGQQAAWDAAADQGLIDRGARKVWIATSDRRTCPICRVLDGQTVGFQDNFAITEEATGFTSSGEVAGTRGLARPQSERTPPAHSSCRCTTGLVV
jgi:F like protein